MAKAGSARPTATVDELVGVMRERAAEIVEQLQRRIRAEIAFYAEQDVVGADELRTSLAGNVAYVLNGLAGDGGQLHAPAATGRTRAAQGAPLVEMLAAYRLGFAELWSTLVATARSMPGMSPDVLVDLAGAMFVLQNEYADAAVTAYRDESQQLLRTSERERAALVETILAGTVAKGTLWEVAQALRLPLDGTFLVIASETLELGHDPLPRVESALAALDVSSVWRLQPDLSVGVLSLPKRSRVAAVIELMERQATGRIGVSPVFVELRQAARALRLARLVLDRQPPGPGVEQFQDSPLNMLVAAAPGAALDAAHAVLSKVLELAPEDRDLLLGTMNAWLDAGGSATATGAILFCHPNTVRYRLRRIEDLTGLTLGRPSDVAELVAAVRAWSQLPHV